MRIFQEVQKTRTYIWIKVTITFIILIGIITLIFIGVFSPLPNIKRVVLVIINRFVNLTVVDLIFWFGTWEEEKIYCKPFFLIFIFISRIKIELNLISKTFRHFTLNSFYYRRKTLYVDNILGKTNRRKKVTK